MDPAGSGRTVRLEDNFGPVAVRGWFRTGVQRDAGIRTMLFAKEPQLTNLPSHEIYGQMPRELSREYDLGDGIMTVAVLAPFASRSVHLTDLGRLRLQETERVIALRT